jgi:hypothetical protein
VGQREAVVSISRRIGQNPKPDWSTAPFRSNYVFWVEHKAYLEEVL